MKIRLARKIVKAINQCSPKKINPYWEEKYSSVMPTRIIRPLDPNIQQELLGDHRIVTAVHKLVKLGEEEYLTKESFKGMIEQCKETIVIPINTMEELINLRNNKYDRNRTDSRKSC